MAVSLKKDSWRIKDGNTYRDSAIFSTTLPEDAAAVVAQATSQIDAQEIRADGIVSQATADINTIAQAVESMTQLGTDTTFTVPGMAADAEATGDALTAQSDRIDVVTKKMILRESKNRCLSDSDWTDNAYIDNGNGNVVSNSSLAYSARIPVSEGEVIRLFDLYGGTFGQREIRSVAAYKADGTFKSTSDALGWKVNSYTVQQDVAFVVLSAPKAANYMITADFVATAYEPYFEPYYIATTDFALPAIANQVLDSTNLKNGYACALPKTKFRQTVGIDCTWYKNSMRTPQDTVAYANMGYSRTTNYDDKVTFNTETADSSGNGYLWDFYDPLFNPIEHFDNGTGYGAATVVKAENLSDCSLLAIGDSTIDQDHLTGKLLSYFTEKGHTITLLGTLGSSDPLNRNEGRAGWTAKNYMENTTKNGYTNPFYNPSEQTFDFSYYANTKYPEIVGSAFPGVDFVVIQLGINDLYPANVRDRTEPDYTTIWGYIRAMIDSILAYDINIKIIINLPTTPNADPTQHSIPLFLYHHYVVKYNAYAVNRIAALSDNRVRSSYCHLILNPETDISDNVHPTVAGYNKMAMEVINQINCWQNGV